MSDAQNTQEQVANAAFAEMYNNITLPTVRAKLASYGIHTDDLEALNNAVKIGMQIVAYENQEREKTASSMSDLIKLAADRLDGAAAQLGLTESVKTAQADLAYQYMEMPNVRAAANFFCGVQG